MQKRSKDKMLSVPHQVATVYSAYFNVKIWTFLHKMYACVTYASRNTQPLVSVIKAVSVLYEVANDFF
jgi:hypothetical protein